jgi:hypothetical protein
MNICPLSRRNVSLALLLLPGLLVGSCERAAGPEHATLIISGARVWTGDETMPWAEAVAVRGDEIVAVGSNADIAPLAGTETKVIDAAGGMLLPGFIDTHVHFATSGAGLASVQLPASRLCSCEMQGHRKNLRAASVHSPPVSRPASGYRTVTGTTNSGAASCRTATGSML